MTMLCDRILPGVGYACRTPLVVHTDDIGRVVAHCVKCERQQRGRCWSCGAARTNDTTRGVFCEPCAASRRRAAGQRHERDARRVRARDRKRNQSPARKAWRKAWIAKNPDRIRAYKRRDALKQSDARRERERFWNSQPERIQKKREQARAAYYAKHPERPSPACRSCGVALSWRPPGRPPVRCDACVPDSVRRKRKTSYSGATS